MITDCFLRRCQSHEATSSNGARPGKGRRQDVATRCYYEDWGEHIQGDMQV